MGKMTDNKEIARQAALADFAKTVKSMQEKSVANGMDELTMDEINAEIAAYRQKIARTL